MKEETCYALTFVTGAILGALASGVPMSVVVAKTLDAVERAKKERDAAWKSYQLLADEKQVLDP
jgi:hypothetical protein